jgi:hypothetical protein
VFDRSLLSTSGLSPDVNVVGGSLLAASVLPSVRLEVLDWDVVGAAAEVDVVPGAELLGIAAGVAEVVGAGVAAAVLVVEVAVPGAVSEAGTSTSGVHAAVSCSAMSCSAVSWSAVNCNLASKNLVWERKIGCMGTLERSGESPSVRRAVATAGQVWFSYLVSVGCAAVSKRTRAGDLALFGPLEASPDKPRSASTPTPATLPAAT